MSLGQVRQELNELHGHLTRLEGVLRQLEARGGSQGGPHESVEEDLRGSVLSYGDLISPIGDPWDADS